MAKRIPLSQRLLPNYTRGEELMNMITHIVGGGFGVLALVLGLVRTVPGAAPLPILGVLIYGLSLIALYTVSSVYHGLHPGMGKKVMQVIDHCTIYALIAGTYTPVLISAFLPQNPALGWGLPALGWRLAAFACTLTAIDLRKFRVFSMICYIGMGWAILPFWRQTARYIGTPGFVLLLLGGISYTVGAILYGIGSKRPWFHSVFHIFVVLGSLLQFLSIFFYVL